ncbi:type II secretion system protein N [Viridibacterium curvum]|uniref:Type II secretion system protein GspC N-terminal domain-containing protein n=1 Tax=Viridibacterium curvum TaxID=1101404 RepID=A0ABP9QCX9_9RHOO
MALRLPFAASSIQQKLIVSLCWLAALAFTAWVAAAWFWRLQASPTQSSIAVAAADPQVAAQDVASRQLFGQPPAQATAVTAPPPSIVVIGVQTRWGKLPGYAIIRDGGSPSQSWVEGENLASGVKLARVRADGIEVERNGNTEFIALNVATASGAGNGSAVSPTTQAAGAPVQSFAPPPPPPPPEKDKGD